MIICDACEQEIPEDKMGWNYGAPLCIRCAILLGYGRGRE